MVFLGDDQIIPPEFLIWHLLAHVDGACVLLGECNRYIHTHLFSPSEPAVEGIASSPLIEAEALRDLTMLEDLVSASRGWQPTRVRSLSPTGARSLPTRGHYSVPRTRRSHARLW